MNKTAFVAFLSIFLSAALILQGLLPISAAAQTVTSAYATQSAVCPQLTFNLYRGLSDSYTRGQVSQLQQFLANQGYYQPVTGYYGPLTTANVAQFQRQYAVYPITGGVGPLTRAAIVKACGNAATGSGFYLNQAFSLSINQTASQYNGQLDVTLNSITAPYTYATAYSGYAQSATITLGLRCQAGTQCLYYPTQQVTLAQGQSTTWQGYTVTLTTLGANSATFVITSSGSGITQGSLSANPTSGAAPLSVYFTGSVSAAGQYIISYGDGATSGPIQANCLSNQPYPGYSGSGYGCSINATHTYATAGTFTATLSPYIACQYSNPRCMIATQSLGQVTVTVGLQMVGGITVTAPAAGQSFLRGDQMQISWGYPVTPNSTQMAIELYTASGSRVGLIAVSGSTSGSYAWYIPGYPQNYMCTMQYPNGLCGTSIPTGQYYIKVSATNNPLDANPTVIASGTSGVFTIVTQ